MEPLGSEERDAYPHGASLGGVSADCPATIAANKFIDETMARKKASLKGRITVAQIDDEWLELFGLKHNAPDYWDRGQSRTDHKVYSRFRGVSTIGNPYFLTEEGVEKAAEFLELTEDERTQLAELVAASFEEFKAGGRERALLPSHEIYERGHLVRRPIKTVDFLNDLGLSQGYSGKNDLCNVAAEAVKYNAELTNQYPQYRLIYAGDFGAPQRFERNFKLFPHVVDKIKAIAIPENDQELLEAWDRHITPLTEKHPEVLREWDQQIVQASAQNIFAAASSCMNKGEFIEWLGVKPPEPDEKPDWMTSVSISAAKKPSARKEVDISANAILDNYPSQEQIDQLLEKMAASGKNLVSPPKVNMGRASSVYFKKQIDNPYKDMPLDRAVTESYARATEIIDQFKQAGQWEDVKSSLRQGSRIG